MINKKVFFFIFILFCTLSINAQVVDLVKNSSSQQTVSEDSKGMFWNNVPYRTSWTNDYEGIFSASEEEELNKIIQDFEKETSNEIAIVTVDSSKVSAENFEDLSLHIAKTWGVGKKEKSNGILIAISKGHRLIRIQNGDGIVLIISDEETAAVIQNEIIPYFREGKFFEGTRSGLFKLMELLRK